MRLSAVVELLLILLLVAFAAYGRVIDREGKIDGRAIKDGSNKQSNLGISTLSLKQAADNVNRYCTCNEDICNCCRDFHIPLVQLQGPGCASLQYMKGDNLAVQLSFGDNILTSTIVSGRNPKPVCVPLPGGFTKFCGRIYSIKRENKDHFKACLGLELQSSTELEASLRVSCFRFGPDGLKLRPAEPLPVVEAEASDDDDDDDFFGLGGSDDDDDDEDEGTSPLANSVTNTAAEEDEDEDEDEDILGFGALLDAITGEDDVTTKRPKVTTPAPLLQFTIPILTKPTSAPSVSISEGSVAAVSAEQEDTVQADELASTEEETSTGDEFLVSDATAVIDEAEEIVTEASNKIISVAKPGKTPTKKFTASDKKKPSITSTSINAIDNNANKKKPLKKPVKVEDDDDDEDLLADDLDDDDDDEEEELLSDDDDDEKDNEEDDDDDDEKIDENGGHKDEDEDEDEKAEIEDLDDDDDEEEDAVISALVEEDGKKKGKVKKHQESFEADEEDSDYGLGLTGLLARSRHSRNSRQSKEMKL